MQVKAVQKYVRTSPRKLRLVADVVRYLTPNKALEVLPNLNKRASEPLAKVIKTAIANAHVAGASDNELKFKEIQINEGPRLKRGRPVSRGRWHPYKRRMSHIRVVLETIEIKSIKGEATKKPANKEVQKGMQKTQMKAVSKLRSVVKKKGVTRSKKK